MFRSTQGSLAQLVEQLAFNQLVVGSNPTRPTTSAKRWRKSRPENWRFFLSLKLLDCSNKYSFRFTA